MRHEVLAQSAMHLIWTAARNEAAVLAYLVAMPRQRLRCRKVADRSEPARRKRSQPGEPVSRGARGNGIVLSCSSHHQNPIPDRDQYGAHARIG